MANFLGSFQEKLNSEYFSGFAIALVFFFITLGLNIYVLSWGIASGVERLAKIALSMLFVFAWIFDMKKGWNEINTGADMKIPVIFKYIIKFITPIYLIGLLIFWTYQDGISVFWM